MVIYRGNAVPCVILCYAMITAGAGYIKTKKSTAKILIFLLIRFQ
jgi:hypothetical protein